MQTASIPHPGRAADRLTPFRIAELSRRSHPLPPRQFQALFDSLFKFLFIFPLAVLFAAVSRPYLALAGITARLGLHSQTTRLVDSSSCAQVRADVALTPPRRPFPGDLGPSVAETRSPDYNSYYRSRPIPQAVLTLSLAVTKGSL
ncbi:hypothetical protein C4D60_Mb00t19700 [Musa balbisiana]|uniref:Uncharacterized protein n=1 Tax=Musa balbisiana TaxID=52838 RepID=A0A4S8I5X6_MUSBA|nr:hypothetical protein C4D60_Mb00t19700 [Musa balbisiana]